MSLGWLKTENLTWNNTTGSEQSGTWDYKVLMHKDLPKNLNITLNKAAPEFENGKLKRFTQRKRLKLIGEFQDR